jgi:hypothetical protein
MKLRYERGALADLDELLAHISADNPKAAARLAARIEEWQGASPTILLWARPHASPPFGAFLSEII